MADTFLQVRTNDEDKVAAQEILSQLGTNMSQVVNMLIKQIIMTKSIPFSMSIPDEYLDKHISPYRIEDVKAVLKDVPESVDEIWIFGSTVTPYCRPDSDLDICIIGNTTLKEEERIFKAPKCPVDIITESKTGFYENATIPGSIYKEVLDKGVLVYRRGENIKWL